MKKLKLNFLENEANRLNTIEEIMHEYGQEINDYAKGYINYIVTATSFDNEIREASLYIIVPEIEYDFKILQLSYNDIENVTLRFFSLKMHEIEVEKICITDGWDSVHSRISELLSSNLANDTFKFLINQIHLKRDFQEE